MDPPSRAARVTAHAGASREMAQHVHRPSGGLSDASAQARATCQGEQPRKPTRRKLCQQVVTDLYTLPVGRAGADLQETLGCRRCRPSPPTRSPPSRYHICIGTAQHSGARRRAAKLTPFWLSSVSVRTTRLDLTSEGEVAVADETDSQDRRKVFVIHGRNDRARRALFDFLRSIGLDPIEWSEATRLTGRGSPYIGQILDAAFGAAQAVVVLQTPDDVSYLHESLADRDGDPECTPQMQPRPNVLFEAGLAMGRDEDRTVIVEMGQMRGFSDIHGRHVVRLDGSLSKRQELANRLETAGCAVRLHGTDWHQAGDLVPPPAPGGGLPLGRKLPSSAASGVPRLEARLIKPGGNKLSSVQVINHGPGDVHDLNVTGDEHAGLYDTNFLPIERLPPGKSIRIPSTFGMPGLGDRRISHFMVNFTGRTADGTPIEQEEFVSGE